MEDPISTSVERRDGVIVLAVDGEIDMVSAVMLERAITAALSEDPPALVIDLSQVQYLDSTGLQMLVRVREKIGESARFAIAAQGPIASRLTRLLHLREILSLHETLEDALAAVKTRNPGSDTTATS
jgi:anti-anti-sigma factor